VNHGDVAPLAVGDIIPGSFFSHKCLLKKIYCFLGDLIQGCLQPHPWRLRLLTESSSTLANGGVVLVNPVPIYIFFSIFVPTSCCRCAWLYFSILVIHFFVQESHHGSPGSSFQFSAPCSFGSLGHWLLWGSFTIMVLISWVSIWCLLCLYWAQRPVRLCN
jgi:hypothetical protein